MTNRTNDPNNESVMPTAAADVAGALTRMGV